MPKSAAAATRMERRDVLAGDDRDSEAEPDRRRRARPGRSRHPRHTMSFRSRRKLTGPTGSNSYVTPFRARGGDERVGSAGWPSGSSSGLRRMRSRAWRATTSVSPVGERRLDAAGPSGPDAGVRVRTSSGPSGTGRSSSMVSRATHRRIAVRTARWPAPGAPTAHRRAGVGRHGRLRARSGRLDRRRDVKTASGTLIGGERRVPGARAPRAAERWLTLHAPRSSASSWRTSSAAKANDGSVLGRSVHRGRPVRRARVELEGREQIREWITVDDGVGLGHVVPRTTGTSSTATACHVLLEHLRPSTA